MTALFCVSSLVFGDSMTDIKQLVIEKTETTKAQIIEAQKQRYFTQNPMGRLANHYALVTFFRSTCQYCQRFEPILAQFAQKYQFEVYPITTDGKGLPSYPYPITIYKPMANLLYGNIPEEKRPVPSLFLVNKNNLQEHYYLAAGVISYPDLQQQLERYADRLEGGK
jgi:conjugal transfer pilus assembly protein TraF